MLRLAPLLFLSGAVASNLPINIQQRDNVALAQTMSTAWTDLGSMKQRFRVRENTSVIVYADVSSIGPKVMLRILIDEESVSTVVVGQKKPSEGRYQSMSFHGTSTNLAAGSHEARVQYLSLCDTFKWEHHTNEDCFKEEQPNCVDGEECLPVATDFPVPSHALTGETRLIVRQVASAQFSSQTANLDASRRSKTIECDGSFSGGTAVSLRSYDVNLFDEYNTKRPWDYREYSYDRGTTPTWGTTPTDREPQCAFEDLFGTSVDFYPPAGHGKDSEEPGSKAVITVDLGWIIMERASLVCRIQAGPIDANATVSLIKGNGALFRDEPKVVGMIASKYYQVSAAAGTYDTIAFHGVYEVPKENAAETRYLASVQCRVDPTAGEKQEGGGLAAWASWGVSSPRRVSVEVVKTKEVATREWADKTTDTVIRLPDARLDDIEPCVNNISKPCVGKTLPIDGRVGYGLGWTALPDPMQLSFTTSKPKTSVLVLADLMQQDPCYYGVCVKRKKFSTGNCTAFRVLVDGQTVAMSEGGAEITVAIRGVALELSAGEHTAEVQYRTNAGSLLFPVVGTERASHRRLTVLQGDYSWCQNVKQWIVSDLQYDLPSAVVNSGDGVVLGSYVLNHTSSPFALPFQTTLTSSVSTESRWDLSEDSREATGTDTTRSSGQSYEKARSDSEESTTELSVEVGVEQDIPYLGSVTATFGYSKSDGRSSEKSSSEGRSSEYSVGLSSTREVGEAITVGTTVVETKEVSQSFGPAELPGCSLHVISIMAKEAKATVPWTATMKPKDVDYATCSYEVSGTWVGASTMDTYTTIYTEEKPTLSGACSSSEDYIKGLPSAAQSAQTFGSNMALEFPDSLAGVVIAFASILVLGHVGALFLGTSAIRLMQGTPPPKRPPSDAAHPSSPFISWRRLPRRLARGRQESPAASNHAGNQLQQPAAHH